MLLAASVDEEGWLSIAFQDKRNLFLCVVEAGVTGRSYVALHIEQSEDEMIEFGSFSIDDAGFLIFLETFVDFQFVARSSPFSLDDSLDPFERH